MPVNFAPTSLDHVALWVDDREPLATFLCDHLGMHVIEETDTFTLVGIDAKLGKLTLFDADGPRQRGALERVVLRVNDLDAALESLPFDAGRRDDGIAVFEAPAGLPIGLVEAAGRDFDLDHGVLSLEDPEAAVSCLNEMGFERSRDGNVAVGDRCVRVVRGSAADGGRPLLNHLAVLVDSAEAVEREVRARGAEVADVVDAANTLAVFVWTPGRIKLEYVEHKPSFSLV
jgi:catechol 2,3-dioxygenase-like lactoylglutathione lyase family enzyme